MRIGRIVGRVGGSGAEVERVIAELPELLDEALLELVAGVVGRNRDGLGHGGRRSSAALEPDAVEPRDRRDALFRQAVRRLVGLNPVPLGNLEDPEDRIVDLSRLLARALLRPAVELAV